FALERIEGGSALALRRPPGEEVTADPLDYLAAQLLTVALAGPVVKVHPKLGRVVVEVSEPRRRLREAQLPRQQPLHHLVPGRRRPPAAPGPRPAGPAGSPRRRPQPPGGGGTPCRRAPPPRRPPSRSGTSSGPSLASWWSLRLGHRQETTLPCLAQDWSPGEAGSLRDST